MSATGASKPRADARSETTQDAESVRVAKILLEEEEWFQKLPASMKDHLSQPNHDEHIAILGRQLARLVAQQSDGHEFVPDDLGDHGWPSYTCAVCGKRKSEHYDGPDA